MCSVAANFIVSMHHFCDIYSIRNKKQVLFVYAFIALILIVQIFLEKTKNNFDLKNIHANFKNYLTCLKIYLTNQKMFQSNYQSLRKSTEKSFFSRNVCKMTLDSDVFSETFDKNLAQNKDNTLTKFDKKIHKILVNDTNKFFNENLHKNLDENFNKFLIRHLINSIAINFVHSLISKFCYSLHTHGTSNLIFFTAILQLWFKLTFSLVNICTLAIDVHYMYKNFNKIYIFINSTKYGISPSSNLLFNYDKISYLILIFYEYVMYSIYSSKPKRSIATNLLCQTNVIIFVIRISQSNTLNQISALLNFTALGYILYKYHLFLHLLLIFLIFLISLIFHIFVTSHFISLTFHIKITACYLHIFIYSHGYS